MSSGVANFIRDILPLKLEAHSSVAQNYALPLADPASITMLHFAG